MKSWENIIRPSAVTHRRSNPEGRLWVDKAYRPGTGLVSREMFG